MDQNSCACAAPLGSPSPKSDVITPAHFARRASTERSSLRPSSFRTCGGAAKISIKPWRKVRKHSKSQVRSSCTRRVVDLHVHTAAEPCSISTANVIAAKDRCENGAAQCSGAMRVHSLHNSKRYEGCM